MNDGETGRQTVDNGKITRRVLDLDMDFFLTDVCELADEGKRPSAGEAAAWSETDVRRFLEKNCGLSCERPVPGAVFETHDGALHFWSTLAAPFAVDHIDAHSDLGIGKPGPAYVLETVLLNPPGRRADIDRYYREQKLDEANYLLFALAFRWISELALVRNPRSRRDVPDRIAVREGESIRALQLTSSVSRLLPQFDFHEPEVPCSVFDDPWAFRARGPYALATMAVSPRYAPREADFIAEVFREYVKI